MLEQLDIDRQKYKHWAKSHTSNQMDHIFKYKTIKLLWENMKKVSTEPRVRWSVLRYKNQKHNL